jgi:predicted aconitase with swiveling domain
MSAMGTITGITLVPGRAQGPTFVLHEPLSFWGGLDAVTGRIIDRWHPQAGEVISGHALVMEAGRGSSSGSSVLAEALRRGTGPCAILLLTRDAIVTVGAMISAELYGTACPVVLIHSDDWERVATASRISIEASLDRAEVVASS